jgi:hypothetical protein
MPKKIAYSCTECGRDAFIGYGASKQAGNWGGKVKPGERLCTSCFQKRGGMNLFANSAKQKGGI